MNEEATDLEKAKDHLHAYATAHLQLVKLEIVERSADVGASIVVSVLSAALIAAFVFFVSVAVALFLGDLWSGYQWGFLAVGGFYLLVFLIYSLIGRRTFQRIFSNGLIKKIYRNHE